MDFFDDVADAFTDNIEYLVNPALAFSKDIADEAGLSLLGEEPTFEPNPNSGGGGGGPRAFDLTPYLGVGGSERPNAPRLQQYTGNSGRFDVGLTRGEMAAEGQATKMLSDPNGNYLRSLSGEPDYAQVNKIMGMQQRDFNLRQRPQMQQSLSASPYGNTGLSRQEEMNAQLAMSDQNANLMFAEYERAKQEAIQSAQILPTLTGVAGLSRNNEVNNLIRDMQIHFENQGIKQDQYMMEVQEWADRMAQAQLAMSASGFGGGGGGSRGPAMIMTDPGEPSLLGALLPVGGAIVGASMGGGPTGAMLGANLGASTAGYLSGNYQIGNTALANSLSTWNAQ